MPQAAEELAKLLPGSELEARGMARTIPKVLKDMDADLEPE